MQLEPLFTIVEAPKEENFADRNKKAKSKLVTMMRSAIRRYGLTYADTAEIIRAARVGEKLKQKGKGRKLPKLLSESDLRAFFNAIQSCGKPEHELMLKFLCFTAVRVSELVNMKVADVDLGNCKAYVDQGKGSKDRCILFPDSLRPTLAMYLDSKPGRIYLFESQQNRPYSTRRIEQIVKRYQEKAGIAQRVHPHLFRHQMLSWLGSNGIADAKIQLISGHENRKSLEIYQHLNLEAVSDEYQNAAREMEAILNGRHAPKAPRPVAAMERPLLFNGA